MMGTFFEKSVSQVTETLLHGDNYLKNITNTYLKCHNRFPNCYLEIFEMPLF